MPHLVNTAPSMPVAGAAANTRLGLHVTSAEVSVWQTRATSGPYKTAGDVSTNSPGDWTRIKANADSMVSSPETTWSGQSSASCWTPAGPLPGRTRAEKVVCAGFAWLILNDTSYRDAAKTLLLNQAAVTGTKFEDTVRWKSEFATAGCFSIEPGWEICLWLTKLLFAYDYIRSSLSGSDQTTLDTWFLNAAQFISDHTDLACAVPFPGRLSDDYTNAFSTCDGPDVVYFGATFNHCDFHGFYENTACSGVQFFGQAAILLNNTTLKNRAKRFYQEWLRYAIFANNATVELWRWNTAGGGPDSNTSLGWSYGTYPLASAMPMIADAFARIGDTSLYDYSTSTGTACCTPNGGPKSLDLAIIEHCKYVDGTVTRYGTDSSGEQDTTHRIRSVDGASGDAWVDDCQFCQANRYYKSNYIKTIYMRTASGAPGYPASPANSAWEPYMGALGVLPGALFMFGQMENETSPYL